MQFAKPKGSKVTIELYNTVTGTWELRRIESSVELAELCCRLSTAALARARACVCLCVFVCLCLFVFVCVFFPFFHGVEACSLVTPTSCRAGVVKPAA
jgi:hypothetical protein